MRLKSLKWIPVLDLETCIYILVRCSYYYWREESGIHEGLALKLHKGIYLLVSDRLWSSLVEQYHDRSWSDRVHHYLVPSSLFELPVGLLFRTWPVGLFGTLGQIESTVAMMPPLNESLCDNNTMKPVAIEQSDKIEYALDYSRY